MTTNRKIPMTTKPKIPMTTKPKIPMTNRKIPMTKPKIPVTKPKIPMTNRNTVRPLLLITLSHCEKGPISQSDVIARLTKLYSCRSIVVSREPHACGGYHFHIFLETWSASKNTFRKHIRETFSEFAGRQIDVQAKKGLGPVFAYITKFDKSPLIWGEYDLKFILKKASASEKRKRGFIKEKTLTPSGVNKNKRRLPLWLKRVLWGLFFLLFHYALKLEMPPLFLFLGKYLSLIKEDLVQLWEGLGDDTTPGLPKSDSSWEEVLPTILIIGCAAFIIITSIFRPEE